MTKTGKRIIAVTLLCLTVLLVGCLVFTGSRLTNVAEDFTAYKSKVYEGKDGTMVAFTENGALYEDVKDGVVMLAFTDYADGVITMKKQEELYTFVAVGEDALYDGNTKQLLIRRGAYE